MRILNVWSTPTTNGFALANRHRAPPRGRASPRSPSDLAEHCRWRRALEAAGVSAQHVDLILVGTTTHLSCVSPTSAPCSGSPGNRHAARPRAWKPHAAGFHVWCSASPTNRPAGGREMRARRRRRHAVAHRRLEGSGNLRAVRRRRRRGALQPGASPASSAPACSDGRYKDLLMYPAASPRALTRCRRQGRRPDEGNEVFKVAVNTWVRWSPKPWLRSI